MENTRKWTEETIEKDYSDGLFIPWTYICASVKLSESFIEKYKDKVSWKYVSKCQKLSEEFMKNHIKRLDIKQTIENQNYSFTFLVNFLLFSL